LKEKAGDYAEAIADFIQARRVRREVLRICRRALDDDEPKSGSHRYWLLATMWEASAGLENDADAANWEQQARSVNAADWMLASTRSRLEKLKGLLSQSPLKHLQS
jgi:hypothetical protein